VLSLKKSFNSTKSPTVRGGNTWLCDALHLNNDLCFNLLKTKYRLRYSEMLSGLCSAFGTCWVVQCHPSIEFNPRISTTEHVHALYFLSHIGCTVTINRVKKSPKRCHSIGWKRPCDNQKFNRKEYFTKSPRVFQTATFRNLLTRQQSCTYYYQVCESSNSISCLKFHIEKNDEVY
jgi:hypothetical protein